MARMWTAGTTAAASRCPSGAAACWSSTWRSRRPRQEGVVLWSCQTTPQVNADGLATGLPLHTRLWYAHACQCCALLAHLTMLSMPQMLSGSMRSTPGTSTTCPAAQTACSGACVPSKSSCCFWFCVPRCCETLPAARPSHNAPASCPAPALSLLLCVCLQVPARPGWRVDHWSDGTLALCRVLPVG
jgi:hypothetical protein